MAELLTRFIIGGLVVSSFAVLGDTLKPKSFAGLFSAAPSVALATIGLTVSQHGPLYTANEANSMMYGAVAFVVYAWVVSQLLFRRVCGVFTAAFSTLVLWMAAAFGLWVVLAR